MSHHYALKQAAIAISLLFAASIHADTGKLTFDIPAEPLEQAVNRIAKQADVQVLLASSLASGKSSPALKGQYTAREALEKLLAGSGLTIQDKGGNSFIITAEPQKDSRLPEVNVTASRDNTNNNLTENTGLYTVQQATVGGKMGESLRETPRSISVITRQQLDDQRMLNFYDAISQLPGVTSSVGTLNREENQFFSRGNRLDNIMADGLSISTRSMTDSDARGGGTNTGMAKYDSVQLLRGPDALFSGNGQPSGSINLIRKHPTQELQIKTALSGGSWNNYAGEFDLSSPLTETGNIRGRLVAARNTSDHFYESANSRKTMVYGIIDADLTPNTLLSIGASKDTSHGAPDLPPGFPRYTNGDALKISRSTGYPSWAKRDLDTENYFATIEQKLGDDWKFKAGISDTKNDGESWVPYYNGAVDPSTLLSKASSGHVSWKSKVQAFDINLTGTFSLFERQHKLAVGFDQSKAKQHSLVYTAPTGITVTQDISYSDFDEDNIVSYNYVPFWENASKYQQSGLYAYGQFELIKDIKLILGGRYASFKAWSNGFNYDLTHRAAYNKVQDTSGIFTPYYALMWNLTTEWTSYISMTESYEDQSRYFNASQQALDPTTGRSWEIGLKGEHFNGRLNSSVAIYRSLRRNYAVYLNGDPSFSLPGRNCCYAGDGKFLSQGLELELSGVLTPNWQINAGYTYDDNTTEYGTDAGNRYASYTPKHMLKLWSSYQLSGSLSALRVGGGVQAQSSSYRSGSVNTWNPTGGLSGTGAFDGPTVPYDFMASGRAIWNAFAEYKLNNHWNAALNINNAFDKRYHQTVYDTNGNNFYGAPRSMMLTLRGTF
ncbi:TonB-dependent siderophore receptor [Methylobacillus pratensis]